MLVFDTKNPRRKAWEVGEQWVQEMDVKYPGRFKRLENVSVKEIGIKKKVVVPPAGIVKKK